MFKFIWGSFDIRCYPKFFIFVMRSVFLITILFITRACQAQLPANFNLVPNSQFDLNSHGDIDDTTFNNNETCWVRAGRGGGHIDIFFNGYYDTTHQITVKNLIDYYDGAFLQNRYFRFKKSTLEVVDTNRPYYSDYIQTKLLEPLLPNITYTFAFKLVSFKLSPTAYKQVDTSSGGGTILLNRLKNIGAYFSHNQIRDYGQDVLHYSPQINFTQWTSSVTDTVNEVILKGSFTAMGGEQYLTIGNFDYFIDYNLDPEFPNYELLSNHQPDTFDCIDAKLITSVSLVRDTTQPMISLSQFSLGNDTVICPNDTLTLGGEPYFFHYWWNTGDTTRFIEVTQPGTYWCTVDFGCATYTDTIHIRPPLTTAFFDIPDTSVCDIDYTVQAPPGFARYLWSDNSTADSLHITTAGTFWLHADNGCGLTHTDTFTVSAMDTAQPPSPLSDIFLCSPTGETVIADTGFASYLWSTGDTTQAITIIQPGTYTLEVVSRCGAVYRDTVEAFAAVTEIDLGNDTLICNAAMNHTLSIPASLSDILWSTGSNANTITIIAPGIYYVTAASPCGVLSDTIIISFCIPEIENVSLSSQTICVGECIIVSGESSNYPQTWLWSFEGGTPDYYNGQTPTPICYTTVGNYNITLIAGNAGGSDTFTSTINVLPVPQGRFDDTTINVPYKTLLHLQACAEGQHVYWYRGDSLVCSDCAVYSFEAKDWQSVYYCVVENAEGICSDTCFYNVHVYDIPTDVWLPTAFSPNGDGRNDKFKVLTDNPNFLLHSLSVYNRWGQRIYYGTNDKGGWDGTFDGKPVENGVYFWSLKYRILGVDKEFFYLKGDVTVVR